MPTGVLVSNLLFGFVSSALSLFGSVSTQEKKDQLVSEEAARQIQASLKKKEAGTFAQKNKPLKPPSRNESLFKTGEVTTPVRFSPEESERFERQRNRKAERNEKT